MTAPAIRQVAADDLPGLVAMNNAAVPAVNELSLETMQRFAETAPWFGVACSGRAIDGFLVALDEKADYPSLNYRWFRERYPEFTYVDRVVVGESVRRGGIGRLLYGALEAWARERGSARMCAEVNVQPPNPGSIAFHCGRGFIRVGELAHDDEGKKVAMFLKPLS